MSKKNLAKDKSGRVHQRDKVSYDLVIKERDDLTTKQQEILEAMGDKKTRCVFIDGLWGTSKSYLSILASLRLLKEKKVDGIIYVRNLVESSTTGKVGLLPGSIEDRTAPYNAIFYEKLDEFLPAPTISQLKLDQRVECLPLSFARGRSFNCKAIVVDEAASMTFDDLLLLLSRCGPFTRIFIVGDSINQNDIGSKSGFSKMFRQFSDEESQQNGVFTFEMKDKADIVRSGFVRFVMEKTGMIKKHPAENPSSCNNRHEEIHHISNHK